MNVNSKPRILEFQAKETKSNCFLFERFGPFKIGMFTEHHLYTTNIKCMMHSIHQLRFCDNVRPAAHDPEAEAALVPVEEPAPKMWTSEPTTLDQLLEMYYVENKLPGREPGTVLLLTHATARNGECSEIVPNQKFKLFLVAWWIIFKNLFKTYPENMTAQ